MNDFIKSFISRPINTVENYKRFYHTLAYVKSLSARIPSADKAGISELMLRCGYKKINKFIDHRIEWDSFKRRIPRKYFDFIGIDYDVLNFTLDLDKEDYERACSINFFTKTASIRIIPTVYNRIEFDTGITEKQALEQLKAIALKTGKSCMINIPDIKTVMIEPEGKVFTKYYPPGVEFGKAWIIFYRSCRSIGEVTI